MFEVQKKLLKRIEKRWFPELLRGRYLLFTLFFNLIFLRAVLRYQGTDISINMKVEFLTIISQKDEKFGNRSTSNGSTGS